MSAVNAAPQASRTVVLEVVGVRWASEAAAVRSVLSRRPGVITVEPNPVAQTATVTFDPEITTEVQLVTWIRDCGYHCGGESVPDHLCPPIAPAARHPGSPHRAHHVHEDGPGGHANSPAGEHAHHDGHAGMSMADMVRDMRNRFVVAAFFSLIITLWSPLGRELLGFTIAAPFGLSDNVFQLLLSVPVAFYSANIFFIGAWRALRARTLDMMVLVAVGVGTGWLYSVAITLSGSAGDVFFEASAILTTFVLLGHYFEMRARGGANDAVKALLTLAPATAIVIRGDEQVQVPSAELQVGDLLLVRPGAKLAVDGLVEDGDSDVDESMVTGESIPVHKGPGDDVIAATINTTGVLRVRATKVGSDTALAHIVKLVQEAQNSKAPGQRLADRAAFWLVLVALIGGALTFAVWMLAGASASEALLFAITVVVVTCPDALGLATPMAIMVGTGMGAERGVLFKNATAVEASSKIDVVVMDKTGTLTLGTPEVTDVIVASTMTEAEAIRLVAAVEQESEHPLAQAIVSYVAGRGITVPRVSEFSNWPGQGATAVVDGHHVVAGNPRLMRQYNIDIGQLTTAQADLAASGRTAIMGAVDGRAVVVIGLADTPRPTASAAVSALRAMGVEVVMLTGDNAATAQRIAAEIGVSTFIADVLPADKAAAIIELQAKGRTVAMVGDGVNDAPALAAADVGIAIGAGTDVAIETADVVLMRSDPLDVAHAVHIGRATVRKMKQNLAWAVGYNSLALPIAAGVFVPTFGLMLRPEIAAITMSGSSLIVALNALALKRTKVRSP